MRQSIKLSITCTILFFAALSGSENNIDSDVTNENTAIHLKQSEDLKYLADLNEVNKSDTIKELSTFEGLKYPGNLKSLASLKSLENLT